MNLARISEHQLSPDGTAVAFVVQRVDIEANTKPRQIWAVPLAGGTPAPLTDEGNNYRPKWSPDSKKLAFISTRGTGSQVWTMDADGRNQKQLTTIATEADGVMWTGDGKNLVFISEVYPDCTDEACNTQRLELDKASKVKARIITSLLYRHWDQWQGPRRKHLFAVSAEGGSPRDLTPGPNEVPPFSLGGSDDYAAAADGNEVCFTMNADPSAATSTNTDLYVVATAGGEARKLTDNLGADNSPVYSPDGRYLAYRSQARTGFEADRWRLMLIDRATGRSMPLTEGLDRNVGSISFAPDSKRIFFSVEDRGRSAIQMVPVTAGATKPWSPAPATLRKRSSRPTGRPWSIPNRVGLDPRRSTKPSRAAVPRSHLLG